MTQEELKKIYINVFYEYYHREYGLERDQMDMDVHITSKGVCTIHGNFLDGRKVIAQYTNGEVKMIILATEAFILVPECNVKDYLK